MALISEGSQAHIFFLFLRSRLIMEERNPLISVNKLMMWLNSQKICSVLSDEEQDFMFWGGTFLQVFPLPAYLPYLRVSVICHSN